MQKHFVCAMLACLALAASGQTLVNSRRLPDGGSATFRPVNSIRPPVLAAPVSYELHAVRVQTLDDGTHITHTTRLERFWRDSKGRTRLDRFYITPEYQANPRMAAWPTAEIADPESGFWYTLDHENKIAHRGRLPNPTPAPTPPAPPASVAFEELGTQTIHGMLAEGGRTTITVPANAQGNDRPLVTTTETWRSPELGIVMLVKAHNPVSGDTTTDLQNFSRAEPDATLFAPPADYRIVDETLPFTISWGRAPASNNPESAGRAYRIGGGVSPPVPIYQPEPRYDEEARKAKIQGTVLLSLVVDEAGKPVNVRVTRSLHPGLDREAIECVSKWQFKPGMKDGKPVPVMASIEVNFRLLDGPKQ
jgi:TonB family protein